MLDPARRLIEPVLEPADARRPTPFDALRRRRVTEQLPEAPAERPGSHATLRSVQTGTSGATRAVFKPLRTLDEAGVAEWRDLAVRAAEPNPFFDPDVAVPAARWLPDGADAELLCVYEQDELVFAAPVRRTRRWRRLRLSAMTTWCHPQCFVGVPLVDPGRSQSAWQAALTALEQRRPRAHVLILELMPLDGPAFEALEEIAGSRVHCYERYTRAVLRRASLDGDATPMPGRRRRELERRARQVERETGRSYTTEDEASVPGAVDAFLDLEAAGWPGREGTALASQPDTAAFARDAATALHEDQRLVLLNTRAGTGVAAGLFSIRRDGTLFMYKIAFDEQLARFSPGVQLVYDLSRWFARDDSLVEIDSCADPANEFINRLFPDRKRFGTVVVGLDGVGSIVAKVAPALVKSFRRLRRRA